MCIESDIKLEREGEGRKESILQRIIVEIERRKEEKNAYIRRIDSSPLCWSHSRHASFSETTETRVGKARKTRRRAVSAVQEM